MIHHRADAKMKRVAYSPTMLVENITTVNYNGTTDY